MRSGALQHWRLVLASVALLAAAAARLDSQAVVDRPGGARPTPPAKPRIAPLPEAQWTDEHRRRIAVFLGPGERPGNSFRTLLHAPELVDRTLTFHTYITRDSSLSPRVRELLALRTAWLHGSDVLWRERAPFARRAGFTNEDFRKVAVGPSAPGWDPFEANLLRMADQLFRNSFVNDAVYDTIAARYDTCQVMDAGLTVADVASLSLLYNTLGVQPDDAAGDRM